MLNRRVLMIMYGFGLIAIITEMNYGWRIRPGKRVSVEIAAPVTQRIWQRKFLWFGIVGGFQFWITFWWGSCPDPSVI